jgi:hypothetical protein
MSTTEIIDGSVVEDTPTHDTPTNLPARRERRSEVIRALPVDQLAESFNDYQDLLPKLLDKSDYQDAGRGETFVKKSGWRKIATAFDLDVTLISSTVERDHDGTPLRAEVIARAIAPSGRSMDGDGYCSIDEKRFKSPSARGKLENDLRATATTRAKNRAIADLVGMGAVSAEEVSAGPAAPALPAWAAPGNSDAITAAIKSALAAAGIPPEHHNAAGPRIWSAIATTAGGQIPAITVSILEALSAGTTEARHAMQTTDSPAVPA